MTTLTAHLRTAIANLRQIEREHARYGLAWPTHTNPHAEPLRQAEADLAKALDALEGAQGAEPAADVLANLAYLIDDVVADAYVRGAEGRDTETSPQSAKTLHDAIAAALSPAHVPEISKTTATRTSTPAPKEPPHDTIRVCPERDGRCPHGISCPFWIDRYHCDMAASRTALAGDPKP